LLYINYIINVVIIARYTDMYKLHNKEEIIMKYLEKFRKYEYAKMLHLSHIQ